MRPWMSETTLIWPQGSGPVDSMTLAAFPLQYFANKRNISQKYNCNMLVFPLYGVRNISYNCHRESLRWMEVQKRFGFWGHYWSHDPVRYIQWHVNFTGWYWYWYWGWYWASMILSNICFVFFTTFLLRYLGFMKFSAYWKRCFWLWAINLKPTAAITAAKATLFIGQPIGSFMC